MGDVRWIVKSILSKYLRKYRIIRELWAKDTIEFVTLRFSFVKLTCSQSQSERVVTGWITAEPADVSLELARDSGES